MQTSIITLYQVGIALLVIRDEGKEIPMRGNNVAQIAS